MHVLVRTPISALSQVDCVVSQWSGWGECSATCEAGEEIRTRTVETDAEFDPSPQPTPFRQ